MLILNPLSHKTSCTKCVAYFYEKVPGTDAFGVNYGNTNNFPGNRSKTHKINILGDRSISLKNLVGAIPTERFAIAFSVYLQTNLVN